jgi:hypothetical protein
MRQSLTTTWIGSSSAAHTGSAADRTRVADGPMAVTRSRVIQLGAGREDGAAV